MDFWRQIPSDVHSPLERRLLAEMSRVACQAHQRMWTAGTAGNFSVRVRPNIMWISRSGVNKGELTSKDFIAFDLIKGEAVNRVRKPSDETALHAAIYHLFPDVRSVVHCHPPYVVAQSLKSQTLAFDGHEMNKAFGKSTHEETLIVPLTHNTQDMAGLAKVLRHRIDQTIPALVLRGHGVYAWASSPPQAMAYVEALEFLCQQKQI